MKKGPGQPMLRVEEMKDLLTTLIQRPHSSWTAEEKQEVVRLMRNRAGIDRSDQKSLRKLGLRVKFKYFLGQLSLSNFNAAKIGCCTILQEEKMLVESSATWLVSSKD